VVDILSVISGPSGLGDFSLPIQVTDGVTVPIQNRVIDTGQQCSTEVFVEESGGVRGEVLSPMRRKLQIPPETESGLITDGRSTTETIARGLDDVDVHQDSAVIEHGKLFQDRSRSFVIA
jgi:hypothetical protein